MKIKKYECWSRLVAAETVKAIDSYSARKLFAAKHNLQVSETMARIIRDKAAA